MNQLNIGYVQKAEVTNKKNSISIQNFVWPLIESEIHFHDCVVTQKSSQLFFILIGFKNKLHATIYN